MGLSYNFFTCKSTYLWLNDVAIFSVHIWSSPDLQNNDTDGDYDSSYIWQRVTTLTRQRNVWWNVFWYLTQLTIFFVSKIV